jgi:hypothetical protein
MGSGSHNTLATNRASLFPLPDSRFSKALLVSLVLFTGLVSPPLFAQDVQGALDVASVKKGFYSFFSLNLGGSLLVFPVDPSALSYDQSPLLPSPHFGLGIPFAFPGTTTLSFELSYDGYFTNYLVPDSLAPQRPFPASIEHRSSFVLGNMVGVNLQGKSEIAHFVSLRYSAGLVFDLRYITLAFDLNEIDLGDAEPDTELTKEYFWSDNRFVFPTAALGVDFKMWPHLSLGLEGRVWFPLYTWLNDEEDLYALEGWRFGIAFRLTFLNDTPDSKIRRELEKIKAFYKTERNDYAFILYHLTNNPFMRGGASSSSLAEEIAKTYKRSRVFPAERKSITNTTIVNMFSELDEVLPWSYAPMADLISKKGSK